MARITRERVKDLVTYHPKSGEFRWNYNRYSPANGEVMCREGELAGHYGSLKTGVRLTLDNRVYQAGRVAWLYMTGEWPTTHLAYFNGNTLDLRWDNITTRHGLRLKKESENERINGKMYPGIYYRLKGPAEKRDGGS